MKNTLLTLVVSVFLGLPLVVGGVAASTLFVLEVFFGPDSLWQPPTPAYEVASWFSLVVCIVGSALIVGEVALRVRLAPPNARRRTHFLYCLSILCGLYLLCYLGARDSHVIAYTSNANHPIAEKRTPGHRVGSDFGGWFGRALNLGYKPVRRVEERYRESAAGGFRSPAT